MSDPDHVVLINPWSREYLCDAEEMSKRKFPHAGAVVTPFEIVRSRKTQTGFTPVSVSFDFDGAYFEDVMCAACLAMLTVAKANKIEFNTPNLKSRIKRLLREPK